jgi:hypothetical protein
MSACYCYGTALAVTYRYGGEIDRSGGRQRQLANGLLDTAGEQRKEILFEILYFKIVHEFLDLFILYIEFYILNF